MNGLNPSLLDGIELRPFAATDSIADLTALLHRAYAALAEQNLRFMATHQSDDVTRQRIGQGECVLAVQNGAIWGTVLFKPVAQTRGCTWYDRQDVASIGQFAVEPGVQGNGLGRRLMLWAEERAMLTGARELALDTAEPATHLIEWYTRLGYRFIQHAQWKHTNYRSVILSKALPIAAQQADPFQ